MERRGGDQEWAVGLPPPYQMQWQELELRHQPLWQDPEQGGREERRVLDQQHDAQRQSLLLQHGEEWDNLCVRRHDESRKLDIRHQSAVKCVELQAQGLSQAQKRIHQKQRQQLDKRNRRQWEALKRKHQSQFQDLLEGQEKQWDSLTQRHKRETEELKEKYPDTWSDEEKYQTLDACLRRHQKLEKVLNKKLEKDPEMMENKLQENQIPVQGEITSSYYL